MKTPRKNHDQRAFYEKGRKMEDAIMEAGNRAMQRLFEELKTQERPTSNPPKTK